MGNANEPVGNPVIPAQKWPKPGDQLVLSDEAFAYLRPPMRNEAHDSKGVMCVDRVNIPVITVKCGVAMQEFLVKPDGTPGWTTIDRTWFVFYYWSGGDAVDKEITPEELKRLNTQPSAINCAKCGVLLRDPGYGPTYKHCVICEP